MDVVEPNTNSDSGSVENDNIDNISTISSITNDDQSLGVSTQSLTQALTSMEAMFCLKVRKSQEKIILF